jgi:hypothetical protein
LSARRKRQLEIPTLHAGPLKSDGVLRGESFPIVAHAGKTLKNFAARHYVSVVTKPNMDNYLREYESSDGCTDRPTDERMSKGVANNVTDTSAYAND